MTPEEIRGIREQFPEKYRWREHNACGPCINCDSVVAGHWSETVHICDQCSDDLIVSHDKWEFDAGGETDWILDFLVTEAVDTNHIDDSDPADATAWFQRVMGMD